METAERLESRVPDDWMTLPDSEFPAELMREVMAEDDGFPGAMSREELEKRYYPKQNAALLE